VIVHKPDQSSQRDEEKSTYDHGTANKEAWPESQIIISTSTSIPISFAEGGFLAEG